MEWFRAKQYLAASDKLSYQKNHSSESNDDPQSEDPYLTEIEKDAEMTKKFGANGVFNG